MQADFGRTCRSCGHVSHHAQNFCGACGAALGAPPSGAREHAAEAEPRQVRVMFCDLVGSTVLAERLEAEDLRDVIRGYYDACAASIQRWEGHVAQYLGDGILAYFGYPTAHEDDAERGVRAGLDMLETLARD